MGASNSPRAYRKSISRKIILIWITVVSIIITLSPASARSVHHAKTSIQQVNDDKSSGQFITEVSGESPSSPKKKVDQQDSEGIRRFDAVVVNEQEDNKRKTAEDDTPVKTVVKGIIVKDEPSIDDDVVIEQEAIPVEPVGSVKVHNKRSVVLESEKLKRNDEISDDSVKTREVPVLIPVGSSHAKSHTSKHPSNALPLLPKTSSLSVKEEPEIGAGANSEQDSIKKIVRNDGLAEVIKQHQEVLEHSEIKLEKHNVKSVKEKLDDAEEQQVSKVRRSLKVPKSSPLGKEGAVGAGAGVTAGQESVKKIVVQEHGLGDAAVVKHKQEGLEDPTIKLEHHKVKSVKVKVEGDENEKEVPKVSRSLKRLLPKSLSSSGKEEEEAASGVGVKEDLQSMKKIVIQDHGSSQQGSDRYIKLDHQKVQFRKDHVKGNEDQKPNVASRSLKPGLVKLDSDLPNLPKDKESAVKPLDTKLPEVSATGEEQKVILKPLKNEDSIDDDPAASIIPSNVNLDDLKSAAMTLQMEIKKNSTLLQWLRESGMEILPGIPKFTEDQALKALSMIESAKKSPMEDLVPESYLDKMDTSLLSENQLKIVRCAEALVVKEQRASFSENMFECIRGLNILNCMRIFVWPIIADNMPESLNFSLPTLPIEVNISDLLPTRKNRTPDDEKIPGKTRSSVEGGERLQGRLITPEIVVSNILKDALNENRLSEQAAPSKFFDPPNETLAKLLTPGQLEILKMAEKFIPETGRMEFSNKMYSCVRRFEYFSCIKYFAWPMIKENYESLVEFPDYQISWYVIITVDIFF